MNHANFPASYFDNPTAGSTGIGLGFDGTDFELPLDMFVASDNGEPGLVGPVCNQANNFKNCGEIGADGTPQYAFSGTSPLGTVQSPNSFYTWFHDSDETINLPYNLNLTLTSPKGRPTYQFSADYFFPIDGQGWQDNNLAADGKFHNFAWCLEVHSLFSYSGGETISVKGDDDIWIYINDLLVIDLGGVHQDLTANFAVDGLYLYLTQIYRFDLFFCERHTDASMLSFETDLDFVTLPPTPTSSSSTSASSTVSSGSGLTSGSVGSTTESVGSTTGSVGSTTESVGSGLTSGSVGSTIESVGSGLTSGSVGSTTESVGSGLTSGSAGSGLTSGSVTIGASGSSSASPSGPSSSSSGSTSGSGSGSGSTSCFATPCGIGLQCCDDVTVGPSCYNASVYTCYPTLVDSYALCLTVNLPCGSICYDPSGYGCCNNQLYSSDGENPCAS